MSTLANGTGQGNSNALKNDSEEEDGSGTDVKENGFANAARKINSGFSILLKSTLTCSWGDLGIKPSTSHLVDDLDPYNIG